MGKNVSLVLTTVNASYSKQLDEAGLVLCLTDAAAARSMPGHMSSFFGEVAPDMQIEFAASHGIPSEALACAARTFASYSGERYPISA